MVQLIRLASATNRGASSSLNITSAPADFTVNIQNNITITKNASVALKGLTFSTNDGSYIQVPQGLTVGISGNGDTKTAIYQNASFTSGKYSVSALVQALFGSFLNAYDFQQLVLQSALSTSNTRGFEIIPSIDNDNKLKIEYYTNPTAELGLCSATTSKINTITIGDDDLQTTTITAGTDAGVISAGGCNIISKLMLCAGCFQYKVNLAHTTDVLTLANNNFVVGLLNAIKTTNTNLLIDDYYIGVSLKDDGAGNLTYLVKYNGNPPINTSVVPTQFDNIYFINEKGKIAVYVEKRLNNGLNTRNTSVKLFDAASYNLDVSQLSLTGLYCAMTFLGTNCRIYGNSVSFGAAADKLFIGGSYYTSTSKQSITNDGDVIDEPQTNITLNERLQAQGQPSASGDIRARNGKTLGISFQDGLYQILNTNTRIFGTLNLAGGTIEGNGVIRLAIYGDIIVELLDFDLSSYNSNYPDRKSILYVIEKLEEIGQTGSNIYSFDVNYPIFLNIFNRDDLNTNSFRIRITKDGVPINLTSGATLTLLIDG